MVVRAQGIDLLTLFCLLIFNVETILNADLHLDRVVAVWYMRKEHTQISFSFITSAIRHDMAMLMKYRVWIREQKGVGERIEG